MQQNSSGALGPVSTRQCVDTGMAMVLIALIGAIWTGEHSWTVAAVGLLVANMIVPRIYFYPARLWFALSLALGTVMSKLILSLIFFLVLTPLALLRKALGHDPMGLKEWKKGKGSVFVVRNHAYAAQDIEHPF